MVKAKKYYGIILLLLIYFSSPLLGETGGRRFTWDYGFNLNVPLVFSMPILLMSEKKDDYGTYWEDGFMMQFEPGVAGARLQIGYNINPISYEWPILLTIKGSILRTWRHDRIDIDPDENYIGIDIEYYMAPFTFHFGYYNAITDNDEDRKAFNSFGIGIVFRHC